MQFAFRVTIGALESFIWVAPGQDDMQAEEKVEAALEADGDLDDVGEIELLGEATEAQLNDHNTIIVKEN